MVRIRKYKQSDLRATATLMVETSNRFNHEDASEESVRRFEETYRVTEENISNINKKFSEMPISFTATDGERIVGMLRGTKERVDYLFVDGDYHGQSIGKRLIERFEKDVIESGGGKVTIYSSSFAIPFYQKLGYKKYMGVINHRGCMVQPMKKVLG